MPTRTTEKIRHPLRVRRLEVRAIKRPRSRYILLTLGGDDLADFRSASPTDHVRVIAPDALTGEPAMPRVEGDRLVYDEVRPESRQYTVRRFDPQAGEIDVRVLDHGGDGPISSWARSAAVGDRVGIIGPRGSTVMPDGYANYLLIGDRTAIPAIARWLGVLPESATAQILIAAEDEQDVIELRSDQAVSVRWYTEAGGHPEADQLPGAVAQLELHSPDTWAWAAGEAEAMREVRRILLDKPGLSTDTVRVIGYWRRDVAGHDHHTPVEEL